MEQLQMHFLNVVQTRTLEILVKTVGTGKNEQNISSYADLCKVKNNDSQMEDILTTWMRLDRSNRVVFNLFTRSECMLLANN